MKAARDAGLSSANFKTAIALGTKLSAHPTWTAHEFADLRAVGQLVICSPEQRQSARQSADLLVGKIADILTGELSQPREQRTYMWVRSWGEAQESAQT